jgi:hypothetical protein
MSIGEKRGSTTMKHSFDKDGKGYYFKYIHNKNRDLIYSQKKVKERYLPITMDTKVTYLDKFK